MFFLKDNFLGPPGNQTPPPPSPAPLPSLWVKAERGGDAQVQVGTLQPRSYQAELQAAEPWMQRMQPVQGSVERFLQASRSTSPLQCPGEGEL